MSKKRISYNWLHDTIYSFIWTIIGSTIFILIIDFFVNIQDSIPKDILILSTIIGTIIGLRPLLGLFSVPDTIYILDKKLYLNNGEQIHISDIESVCIKSIGSGAGELTYYEITFFKYLNKFVNRKRKSLVIVERYNIRGIFRTNGKFIQTLLELGFDSKRIQTDTFSLKNFLGIRDKFKS